MSNDNISALPNLERDKLTAGLEALKRTAPQLIELSGTLAEIRKASYDAHIAVGFTPEQALDLCWRLLP